MQTGRMASFVPFDRTQGFLLLPDLKDWGHLRMTWRISSWPRSNACRWRLKVNKHVIRRGVHVPIGATTD